MKTKQDYITILTTSAETLRTRFGIKSLMLFGSVARGEQTENSDVDVFVEMPPSIFNEMAAREYLELVLQAPVDLVRRHNQLRTLFTKRIENDGIRIF